MALEKVCEMDVNIMNFSMHPCGLYEFHILRFVCEAYHVTYSICPHINVCSSAVKEKVRLCCVHSTNPVFSWNY
jgi:hypothetical protein